MARHPGSTQLQAAHGHRCRCFALPGVPAEMKQMWLQGVQPICQRLCGPGRVICHYRLSALVWEKVNWRRCCPT